MATPGTVAFHTLGCKLNYSETSSIGRLFEKSGYLTVSFDDSANYYVINTCSVTDFADKKCRQIVRKVLKQNPSAKVIMMGCYAQLKPQEIADIPGVDLVLGASEKFNILSHIERLDAIKEKGIVEVSPISQATSFNESFSFGDRTRSFLKVQDGCDYNCAFCTIPLARGNSRSNTIKKVLSEAKRIAALGVKEVVLTGVNIGDFGKYLDESSGKFKRTAKLIDLLRQLDQVEGIERFRISSIEPNLCTDEIIQFVANSRRFVPHFHLPLQSGSDKILASMKRRYRTELYEGRVNQIISHMPDACIGVDVIVGYPGETYEDFLRTYEFLNGLDIAYLHVFTYSERPNTIAAELDGVVPMEERRRRNKMLTILSQKKKTAFYKRFAETEQPVLFESSKYDGIMTGFSHNYLKVAVPYQEKLLNTIQNVRLDELDPAQIRFSASLVQSEEIA